MEIVNTNNEIIYCEVGENQVITAVLTIDSIKQEAVYEGIGTALWIMNNGRKLLYKEALRHFPLLKKENYR